MEKHIVVIGAGINGLIAAFYLRRGGYAVTLLEKKNETGGAVATEIFEKDGVTYEYPIGASIFGFMQQFVYEETGLKERLSLYLPKHPEMVYFGDNDNPAVIYDDNEKLKEELKRVWNEKGDIATFYADMDRVCDYLRKGFRDGAAPSLESAERELGESMTRLWISGSAKDLLDHYFTSDEMKVFGSIGTTESGPVMTDSPFSAFSIPLMATGDVFDAKQWGYVRGGIWQVVRELTSIIEGMGVRVETGVSIHEVTEDLSVTYTRAGETNTLRADKLLFATDPLSAAHLLKDEALVDRITSQFSIGSSGKLVLLFKEKIVWKNDTGAEDFDVAMRYFMRTQTLEDMDETSRAVLEKKVDFAPSYFEVYPEGAADRKMGFDRGHDMIAVFFKSLSLDKKGVDVSAVHKEVESFILSNIANPEALIHSKMATPKDLQDIFYFPGGNIDHIALSARQTFADRTYSPTPSENFYQFGSNPNVYYCAAAAYPCGSVGGNAGYMCATQILKSSDR